MSRNKQTYGKHVALTEELLTDPKWRSLSNPGKLIWIMLRREYIGKIDTTISLCHSQVKDMMSRPTFWKAIKELKELRWLEIVSHGGFPKQPNKYHLTGPHGYFIRKGFKLY